VTRRPTTPPLLDRLLSGVALSVEETRFAPLLFSGQLEQGLELAAELDFDRVELSVRDAGRIDVAALERRLAHLDLGVSAIATGQAYVTDGACLAGGSDSDRRRAVDRLRAAIELAAALGASVIVGGIRGRLTGDTAEQARQQQKAIDALDKCAARASASGVTLLLEPINRYETNFVNTAAEGLALLDELGSANVKLLLDTFHMNIEEPSSMEAIRNAGERLAYLHLVDNTRRAPGQGQIAFDRLLDTLEQVGYGGPAIAEILPLPDDEAAARDTAAFWSRTRRPHDPATTQSEVSDAVHAAT
jgi:sugar phosphate isomerase/epimerase